MTSEDAGNTLKERITQKYVDGTLLDSIFDKFWKLEDAEFDSVIQICSELHNEGKVDLVDMVNKFDLDEISTDRFFSGQHFFCKVLPKLESPVGEMMQCVQSLVLRGGSDGAAGLPNAAFREWCQGHPSRSQEVIDGTRNGKELSFAFLTFALEASKDTSTAKEFVLNGSNEQRFSSILALGRMELDDDTNITDLLQAILEAMEVQPTDEVFGTGLEASFRLASKSDHPLTDTLRKNVELALSNPGSLTLHKAAEALLWQSDVFDKDILSKVLGALENVDPNNKGTIDMLDGGLRKLMKASNGQVALDFVERLLVKADGAISLTALDSFSHQLVTGDVEILHRALVGWLMSGEPNLCFGLNNVLGQHSLKLALDSSVLPTSPEEQLFLCKKAIGYFFLQPVTASSILVSVLRHCDQKTALEVLRLLFNPLLLSYGGDLMDYLKEIGEGDPAYDRIKSALAAAEEYLEGLRAVGDVGELHPSENERQLEHFRFSDEMMKAHKEAEKSSVFLSLVSRSTILYGKKTMSFVTDPNGERRKIESELKPLSTSIEFPRMENVDPIGLNYTLMTFRSQRLVK